MFTINLEKKLSESKRRSLSTPKELLFLREYESLADLSKDETLKRLGLSSQLHEGEKIFSSYKKHQDQTIKFNQEKIFHISQIKELCLRYYLRFLPTEFYKGSVDKELSPRVNNFEIAYGVECTSKNTFIMAPATSFKLEPEPTDPLFFYGINEEWFYLIHKWGGDLSFVNRLKAIFSKSTPTFMCVLFASLIPFALWQSWVDLILPFLSVMCMCMEISYSDAKAIGFLRKNKWRSTKI